MYTKTPPLPKLRNDTKLQNGAYTHYQQGVSQLVGSGINISPRTI